MENEEDAAETESEPAIPADAIEEPEPIAEADQVSVKALVLPSGKCPFEDWYNNIRDRPTRLRIAARLARVRAGNLGDFKPVGGEVYEFRIDLGPGYRLYFARIGDVVVVLIVGGVKPTQQKDIKRAIELWKEHKDDAQRYQRDFRP